MGAPAVERIASEAPELRIAPRISGRRTKRAAREERRDPRGDGPAGPYGGGLDILFSGLLKCAACGDRLKASPKPVEERLLDAIRRDLFTPEAWEVFQQEACGRTPRPRAGQAGPAAAPAARRSSARSPT